MRSVYLHFLRRPQAVVNVAAVVDIGRGVDAAMAAYGLETSAALANGEGQ